jgi:hypothetical protein
MITFDIYKYKNFTFKLYFNIYSKLYKMKLITSLILILSTFKIVKAALKISLPLSNNEYGLKQLDLFFKANSEGDKFKDVYLTNLDEELRIRWFYIEATFTSTAYKIVLNYCQGQAKFTVLQNANIFRDFLIENGGTWVLYNKELSYAELYYFKKELMLEHREGKLVFWSITNNDYRQFEDIYINNIENKSLREKFKLSFVDEKKSIFENYTVFDSLIEQLIEMFFRKIRKEDALNFVIFSDKYEILIITKGEIYLKNSDYYLTYNSIIIAEESGEKFNMTFQGDDDTFAFTFIGKTNLVYLQRFLKGISQDVVLNLKPKLRRISRTKSKNSSEAGTRGKIIKNRRSQSVNKTSRKYRTVEDLFLNKSD